MVFMSCSLPAPYLSAGAAAYLVVVISQAVSLAP